VGTRLQRIMEAPTPFPPVTLTTAYFNYFASCRDTVWRACGRRARTLRRAALILHAGHALAEGPLVSEGDPLLGLAPRGYGSCDMIIAVCAWNDAPACATKHS